jgi:hypothetical protein
VPDASSDPNPSDDAPEAEEASVAYSVRRAVHGTVRLKRSDANRGVGTRAEFTFTRDDPSYDATLGDTSPDLPDDNDGPEPIFVSAKP